jgi:Porin PorA
MRRTVGVTLTGLGAFLLVLALMSYFFLPGQIIKFPLNEYTVTTLTGTNMTYFSQSSVSEVNGATVRTIATTQGNVAAGTSSTAIWSTQTGVFDITHGGDPGVPIEYPTETFAFNRRTGALENCCGAEVGTQHPHFSGQGFVWPIGVQKKNYQIFDTILLKPEPAVYSGTTTVDGLNTYIFVEHVTNQQYGTVSVPGSLVGMSQSEVTLPEDLTATNTYYVDPGTGAPVKEIQDQSETLVNPSTGSTALTLFSGTLTSTPGSIRSAVNTASTYDTDIDIVQTIGPLVGGLVAIVLLVVGVLLLINSEDGDDYEYEDDDEEVGAEA